MLQLKSQAFNVPLYVNKSTTQNLAAQLLAFSGQHLDNWWIIKGPALKDRQMESLLGTEVKSGETIRLEHVRHRYFVRAFQQATVIEQGKQLSVLAAIGANKGPGFINYEDSARDDPNSDWVIEGDIKGEAIRQGDKVRLRRARGIEYLAVVNQDFVLPAPENYKGPTQQGKLVVALVEQVPSLRSEWMVDSVFSVPFLHNEISKENERENKNRRVVMATFPDQERPRLIYQKKPVGGSSYLAISMANENISQLIANATFYIAREKGKIGLKVNENITCQSFKDTYNIITKTGSFTLPQEIWWPSPVIKRNDLNELKNNGFLHLMNNLTRGFIAMPSNIEEYGDSPLKTGVTYTGKPTIAARQKDALGVLFLDVNTFDVPTMMNGELERFSYYPGIHSPFGMLFSEQWKLPKKAQGSIVFSAQADYSICIAISSRPLVMQENMYYLSIGGKGNKETTLRKGIYGPLLDLVSTVTVRRDEKPIKGGLNARDDENAKNEYWLKINKNTISLGTGTVVDNNPWFVWRDKDPLPFVQYVGFGGGEVPVQFEAVSFKDLTEDELIIPQEELFVEPQGYIKMPNTVKKTVFTQGSTNDDNLLNIAVGAREGRLVLWGTLSSHELASYDSDEKKWKRHSPKDDKGKVLNEVKACSLSIDGRLYAVIDDGIYKYQWDVDKWKSVPFTKKSAVASHVAVGKNDNLWILDAYNKKIYQRLNNEWKRRSDNAIDLSVAFDGTVIALNSKGKAFKYKNMEERWEPLSVMLTEGPNESKEVSFEQVIAQNQDTFFAVTTDMKLVRYNLMEKQWKPVLDDADKPIEHVVYFGVNAAGTTCLRFKNGLIYRKGDEGVNPQAYALRMPIMPSVNPQPSRYGLAVRETDDDSSNENDVGMNK